MPQNSLYWLIDFQTLASQTVLLDKFVQRRLRWFGHAERMTIGRIPHNALHANFKGKNKGRPRLRWIDNINEDITTIGLTLREAMDLTKDRGQWKSLICAHRCQMAGVINWWWWWWLWWWLSNIGMHIWLLFTWRLSDKLFLRFAFLHYVACVSICLMMMIIIIC